MPHQITITMTDEQYPALAEAAQEQGQPIEIVAQETLARQYISAKQTHLDPLVAHLYSKGKVNSLPSGKDETSTEKAERERLAKSVKPGKSASEMVIEDRGPF